MRRVALLLLGAVVLVVAGGVFFARQGGDPPPPPKLTQRGVLTVKDDSRGWTVAGGSFAGYRVNEDYLGVGVHTAVGRTSAVTGTLGVVGTRVVGADLRVDMTQLRSDQARRDDTLRHRAIETDRFPSASFTLEGPFSLGASRRADGLLTLHGVTAPITVNVSSALRPGRLELIGRAPIAFKDFGIEPPSVAGLVTVKANGVLEFRLVAHPKAG